MKSSRGRPTTGLSQTISLMVAPETRQRIEKCLIKQANNEGRISTMGEFVRTAIEKELKVCEQ